MIHVAVIASDKNWFDQLITQISRLPISFRWFENFQEFFKRFDFENWQLVYIIEKNTQILEEALEALTAKQLSLPIICSTIRVDSEQRQLMRQLGAKEIVPWPITRQELEFVLNAFCQFYKAENETDEYLFQGSLDYIDGVELLRMLCREENTGILSFVWGERSGRIEINNGQIIHAAYRQLDPLTSILVLTSWEHGQVTFKTESFISKRSIMLSNEQIFDECKQYQNERAALMAAFPAAEVKLFTHPDLNFEEFGATERAWLYKMYKGKTLTEIRDLYEGDFNFLLKKLKLWLEKQYILPEEDYHRIKAQREEERATSGVKRLFKKIFTSNKKEIPKNSEQASPKPSCPKVAYAFNDFNTLKTIKSVLEES